MLELAILSFTKVRIFLIPLSIAFSNPQNCRFPFSVKKKLHPRSEIQKIKLQKMVGNSLKIKHEWNGHLEILSLPQGIENSRQFLLLRTDILQKTAVGWP